MATGGIGVFEGTFVPIVASTAAPPGALASPVTAARDTEVCEWLIDNSAAYDRIVQSIHSARDSVWITQLALDADCVAHGEAGSPDVNIADVIVDASKSRGVDVRILMNATLLLDTVKPLRKWLASQSASAIEVRGVSRFPQLLHAKMIIVDGRELFLVGSPFVNGYWDDSRHSPTDSRRPMRELGGRPLHDVSVRVEGPVVRDAIGLYAEWWNAASPCDGDDSPEEADFGARVPRKSDAMRLFSTSPGARSETGRTDILDACIDGISRARSFIYIEHQYLSARPIVEALTIALETNADLELIIVLNQNPDITAYRRWQNDRLGKSGLLNHPRAGIFSLWSTEEEGNRIVAASQVFVHSKVVVVDDNWAMTGSANLDGVSLHSYGDDFAGPVARTLFHNVRNFDVNIVLRDGVGSVPENGMVKELRTRLWAEHLGTSARSIEARPEKGWLSLWKKRARKNVVALDLNDGSHRFRGFVLPYSTAATPAKQWAQIGIGANSASPELRFDPGWMEVYLSPNWIRNMFL